MKKLIIMFIVIVLAVGVLLACTNQKNVASPSATISFYPSATATVTASPSVGATASATVNPTAGTTTSALPSITVSPSAS